MQTYEVLNLFQTCLRKTMNDNPADSDWHLMTLLAIILQIKAKNILELGVRDGHTTDPLVLGASMTGGYVTSVDICPTSWNCPKSLSGFHEFVQSDAIAFLERQNSKYDLVYIDDWHTYKHVKKELEIISNLVTPNSLVLLHDLMGQGHQPNYFMPTSQGWNNGEWEGGGPFKAVNELDKNVWEWATIPVNHGLTILRKKGKIDEV